MSSGFVNLSHILPVSAQEKVYSINQYEDQNSNTTPPYNYAGIWQIETLNLEVLRIPSSFSIMVILITWMGLCHCMKIKVNKIVIFNKFMMFNKFERLATKFMISTPLFWKLIQYCDLWLSFPVNCLKIAHLWSRCWALGIQSCQEYFFYDSVSAESYISLTLGQIMKSFQWKIIYIQKIFVLLLKIFKY